MFHRRGHPVLLDADERHERPQREPGSSGGMHRRFEDWMSRVHVLLRSEEADAAVAAAERLETVEHRLGVVQHGRRRVHRERPVRLDARVVPALLLLEVQTNM